MSDEEIENLVTYLEDFEPSDFVGGSCQVLLTKTELDYIVESINLNYGK